jgi:hypothetical protein
VPALKRRARRGSDQIGARLGEVFGCPVFIDRDVNFLALGQHRASWPSAKVLLCLKVGTVIACGLVVEGNVMRGARGLFGEIGHSKVAGADGPGPLGQLHRSFVDAPDTSGRSFEEKRRGGMHRGSRQPSTGSGRPLIKFSAPLDAVGRCLVLQSMGSHISRQGFDVVVGDLQRRNDQSGDRPSGARRRYYDDSPGPDVFVVNVEHLQSLFEKVHPGGRHNCRRGFHRNDGLVLGFIRSEIRLDATNCFAVLGHRR